MNFKNLLKSSIFDGSEDGRPFEFTLPDSRHQYDLEAPFSLIDNLICKNSHTKLSREGVFALHNRLLVFYEVILQIFNVPLQKNRMKPHKLPNQFWTSLMPD